MTNPIEEGTLPEGITPNAEDALELNADELDKDLHTVNAEVNAELAAREKAEAEAHEAFVNNLPGSLPKDIEKSLGDLVGAIKREIDVQQSKNNRPSEQELNAGIAAFQKVKLDWDRMTPEEQAKAIEAGKHAPVLSDFTKSA